MKISSEVPDVASVCEALLEGFIQAAQVLIRAGVVPAFPRDAGVIYKMEPVGEEDWKLPHNVMRDGWGDCEDLALWEAAGMRETGQDDGARVRIVRIGAGKLHAIVMLSDGKVLDPSLELDPKRRR